MKEIIIREIKKEELYILEDMLYEAIYQDGKSELLPKSIIKIPEISIYIDNFGQKDDHCFVADLNGQIIGAVWIRILDKQPKGYGYIDSETPELAISLFKEYRNQGLGVTLMKKMIEYLKAKNYKQTSLSVDKNNFAVKMYKKLGFDIILENDQDFLMLLKLN